MVFDLCEAVGQEIAACIDFVFQIVKKRLLYFFLDIAFKFFPAVLKKPGEFVLFEFKAQHIEKERRKPAGFDLDLAGQAHESVHCFGRDPYGPVKRPAGILFFLFNLPLGRERGGRGL